MTPKKPEATVKNDQPINTVELPNNGVKTRGENPSGREMSTPQAEKMAFISWGGMATITQWSMKYPGDTTSTKNGGGNCKAATKSYKQSIEARREPQTLQKRTSKALGETSGKKNIEEMEKTNRDQDKANDTKEDEIAEMVVRCFAEDDRSGEDDYGEGIGAHGSRRGGEEGGPTKSRAGQHTNVEGAVGVKDGEGRHPATGTTTCGGEVGDECRLKTAEAPRHKEAENDARDEGYVVHLLEMAMTIGHDKYYTI